MRTWYCVRVFCGCLVSLLSQEKAIAQIIPDQTLGSENSIVTPINPNYNRIDGGAIRGSNLFHSFREFNISEKQAAYFKNPQLIKTIFSRVTGKNASHILGKLGVLGDANLVFINPNGVIFGHNASLDIPGSFVVSTAESIRFPNGSEFSAINPQGVPLLTVDVPVTFGLVFEGDSSGTIYNQADLESGKHLALIGSSIINEGSLQAPQGNIVLMTENNGSINFNFTTDLIKKKTFKQQELSPIQGNINIIGENQNKPSIFAKNVIIDANTNLTINKAKIGAINELNLTAHTIKIRDSQTNSTQIAAVKDLILQGNKTIDIFILNNENSVLFSGKDMLLKSPNAVIGDAKFWTGGKFRVEDLNGELGILESPNDPIIRSLGDVEFFRYRGSSLHIIAGGSVTANIIVVNSPSLGENGVNYLKETITLADGTTVNIDGSKQATLDIRAGVKPEFVGTPNLTGFENSTFVFPNISQVATSADINLEYVEIAADDGLVFLSNQYQPNLTVASGNINIRAEDSIYFGFGGIYTERIMQDGGDVYLDSRNDIYLGADQLQSNAISARSFGKNAGSIFINAKNNINVNQGRIRADSSETGEGNAGDVSIKAGGDITFDFGVISTNVGSVAGDKTKGKLGNIYISGNSLTMDNNSQLQSGLFSGAESTEKGVISLNLQDSLMVNNSKIFANSEVNSFGDTSDINIQAKSVQLNDGFLVSSHEGFGDSGDIIIKVDDNFRANNFNILSNIGVPSEPPKPGSFSKGNVGTVSIIGKSIFFDNGSQIQAGFWAGASGKGGEIILSATDNIAITNNSIIFANSDRFSQANSSNVYLNAPEINLDSGFITSGNNGVGNSGIIDIKGKNLTLTNGSQIQASTNGIGNAGKIRIMLEDTLIIKDVGERASGIFSRVRRNGMGDSEGIIIEANKLYLDNNGLITTETLGKGNAGLINITANETILMNNESAILSNTRQNAIGDAGDININTPHLILNNRSRISALTNSQGDPGNINIGNHFQPSGNISLNNSIISSEVQENATLNPSTNTDKTINLNANILNLTNQATITASSEGKIKAGDININSLDVNLSQASTIETITKSNANAGNININADESITIKDIDSGLFAQTESQGNAGNISIKTPVLNIAEKATISAFTESEGDGGNITINSSNSVTLGKDSKLTVETSASGQAGTITINSDRISLEQNAQLSATANENSTSTKSGEININVNQLNVSGELGIFAETQSNTPAGNLTIQPNNTEKLNINFTEKGFISASTTATGRGGSIKINAPQTINIGGQGTISVMTSGEGNAGVININSQQLNFTDGLAITASTTGEGDAGNIRLHADQIKLNNSQISALTNSQGNAGQILISNQQGNNSQQVTLESSSKLSTEIQENGVSNQPSNIIIKTDNLNLTGSTITTSTAGVGNAGNIQVTNAETISLNQSNIKASTSGESDAGNINLQTNNSLKLQYSNISSEAENNATGDGGSISINSPILNLNSSQISTNSDGEDSANAGSIDINSNQVELNANSQISATTSGGEGGNINLNAITLEILNDSQISTTTQGNKNAGDIRLNLAESLIISGNDSGILANATVNALGNGGNIFIDPPIIRIEDGGFISVDNQGQGIGGNIDIFAGNLILNNGKITAETASNTGGNITLNIEQGLRLDNNSEISTTAGNLQAGGDGGNIVINAGFILTKLFDNNRISANAFLGDGGNITIDSPIIFGFNIGKTFANISRIDASSALGVDGIVNINRTVIDPLRSLDNLPQANINTRIQQGCQVPGISTKVEFYDLGSGGFPANPEQLFTPFPLDDTELIPLQEIEDSPVKIYNNSRLIELTFNCQ